MGLLKDLPPDEYVVDARLAFPEACLFLAKDTLHCCRDALEDDAADNSTGER
ncbi:hypothetical protein DPMN_081130 [Dreissena polymorpha]|uniref:Uncharacterized protein n=1 Tax=Dreissena polymorpha TaxID=45954 RepID=A0A9D3Y8B2_DREPO|nr:hypothetical protein DPMN_081130 [Dreissena polymorpha]